MGLLANPEILDEFGIIRKVLQGKLCEHDSAHDLADLDKRPAVAGKPQALVVSDNHVYNNVADTAKGELQAKWKLPQGTRFTGCSSCPDRPTSPDPVNPANPV